MDPSTCIEVPAEAPARFCVGLAASAGGVNALSRVLAPLPSDFPAAVVVVLYLLAHSPSLLAGILDRKTPLQVRQAGRRSRRAKC